MGIPRVEKVPKMDGKKKGKWKQTADSFSVRKKNEFRAEKQTQEEKDGKEVRKRRKDNEKEEKQVG